MEDCGRWERLNGLAAAGRSWGCRIPLPDMQVSRCTCDASSCRGGKLRQRAAGDLAEGVHDGAGKWEPVRFGEGGCFGKAEGDHTASPGSPSGLREELLL
jgi:hypothetical protein